MLSMHYWMCWSADKRKSRQLHYIKLYFYPATVKVSWKKKHDSQLSIVLGYELQNKILDEKLHVLEKLCTLLLESV